MSIEPDRLVSPGADNSADNQEVRLDRALRPEKLDEYIGQVAV